jgi:hypothetical protein
MALADQAMQMMLGHDCTKEELGGAQRLSATQLAPISRGAQILRQSFKGRARPLGVEDRSKLWRERRLGNRNTKERSGVFPGHQPQQAESQFKERDFGNLVPCKRTFRAGYLGRPPADDLRKQSFLALRSN